MENKVPYISGSFIGWRYKKMIPLHEFTKSIDKDSKDPMEIGKYEGNIRQKLNSVGEFNEYESAYYKVLCSD